MTSKIEEKKKYLLHWMYDFIEDDDEPAYQASDVEEFDQIISVFIITVLTVDAEKKQNFTWIAGKIECLVKSLNELNNKHDNLLIETNQREDICELIDFVIEESGHSPLDDITKQWREW